MATMSEVLALQAQMRDLQRQEETVRIERNRLLLELRERPEWSTQDVAAQLGMSANALTNLLRLARG